MKIIKILKIIIIIKLNNYFIILLYIQQKINKIIYIYIYIYILIFLIKYVIIIFNI